MLRTFVDLACGYMTHTIAREGFSTERALALKGVGELLAIQFIQLSLHEDQVLFPCYSFRPHCC